jgi:hypothetical protein
MGLLRDWESAQRSGSTTTDPNGPSYSLASTRISDPKSLEGDSGGDA